MAEKVLRYEGDDILVTYNLKRCIHAAECIHGDPDVFDPERNPWIDPDASAPERIAAVIHRCPSGALQYRRLDNGRGEPTPDENVVEVQENGPLYITGDIEIKHPDGTLMSKETRVALCRCGLSKNKPFCDNSHIDSEFEDPGLLGTGGVKMAPGAEEDDNLTITPLANGSLRLSGPFRIEATDGDDRMGTRTSLCRCGHSSNKPFCDATHKKIGFEA